MLASICIQVICQHNKPMVQHLHIYESIKLYKTEHNDFEKKNTLKNNTRQKLQHNFSRKSQMHIIERTKNTTKATVLILPDNYQ